MQWSAMTFLLGVDRAPTLAPRPRSVLPEPRGLAWRTVQDEMGSALKDPAPPRWMDLSILSYNRYTRYTYKLRENKQGRIVPRRNVIMPTDADGVLCSAPRENLNPALLG